MYYELMQSISHSSLIKSETMPPPYFQFSTGSMPSSTRKMERLSSTKISPTKKPTGFQLIFDFKMDLKPKTNY